jgi:hypothetical protein
LCITQGLLEFCGQFFESHQKAPSKQDFDLLAIFAHCYTSCPTRKCSCIVPDMVAVLATTSRGMQFSHGLTHNSDKWKKPDI